MKEVGTSHETEPDYYLVPIDSFGGISCNNAMPIWKTMRHDRARADCRTVAEGHAGQDNSIHTQPTVSTDCYWSGGEGIVWIGRIMVLCYDPHVRTDPCMTADLYFRGGAINTSGRSKNISCLMIVLYI